VRIVSIPKQLQACLPRLFAFQLQHRVDEQRGNEVVEDFQDLKDPTVAGRVVANDPNHPLRRVHVANDGRVGLDVCPAVLGSSQK